MNIRPHLIYYSILTVLLVVVVFVCLYYYVQTLEAVTGGAYAKIFIFDNNNYNVSFLWLLGIILIGGTISYLLDTKTEDYLERYYIPKHIDFIYLPLHITLILLIGEEFFWLGSGIPGISEILGSSESYSIELSSYGILNFLISILITILFAPIIYILRFFYGTTVYQDTTTSVSYLLSKIPKIKVRKQEIYIPISNTIQTQHSVQPSNTIIQTKEIPESVPIIDIDNQTEDIELTIEPLTPVEPEYQSLKQKESLIIDHLQGTILKTKTLSIKLQREEILLMLLLSKTYIMDLATAMVILPSNAQNREKAILTRLQKLKTVGLIDVEKYHKKHIICLNNEGFDFLKIERRKIDLKKYIEGEVRNMNHHLHTTQTLVYLYYTFKLEFISAVYDDIMSQIEYSYKIRVKKAVPDIILTWRSTNSLYKEGIEVELNSTKHKIHEKFKSYVETTDCDMVTYYVLDKKYNTIEKYCKTVPYPYNKLKYEIHELSKIQNFINNGYAEF